MKANEATTGDEVHELLLGIILVMQVRWLAMKGPNKQQQQQQVTTRLRELLILSLMT